MVVVVLEEVDVTGMTDDADITCDAEWSDLYLSNLISTNDFGRMSTISSGEASATANSGMPAIGGTSATTISTTLDVSGTLEENEQTV